MCSGVRLTSLVLSQLFPVTQKRCRSNPKPGPPRPSGRVSSNRSRRFPWPANAKSAAAETTWIEKHLRLPQCLLRDCFYPKVWHCQIVRFSRSHFCRALKLAHHPGPLWGNGVPHKIELIKFSHVDRCNLIRFRTVWLASATLNRTSALQLLTVLCWSRFSNQVDHTSCHCNHEKNKCCDNITNLTNWASRAMS